MDFFKSISIIINLWSRNAILMTKFLHFLLEWASTWSTRDILSRVGSFSVQIWKWFELHTSINWFTHYLENVDVHVTKLSNLDMSLCWSFSTIIYRNLCLCHEFHKVQCSVEFIHSYRWVFSVPTYNLKLHILFHKRNSAPPPLLTLDEWVNLNFFKLLYYYSSSFNQVSDTTTTLSPTAWFMISMSLWEYKTVFCFYNLILLNTNLEICLI